MTAIHHVSIRVPWHDNQWSGTVCHKPTDNGACLALPRIAELKREAGEQACAGRRVDELAVSDLPACMAERATFMAPFAIPRSVQHPYQQSSDTHRMLRPTVLHQPSYSAAGIPFRWMNKEFAAEVAKEWRIDFDPDREPKEPVWLFNSGWVQNGQNQRAMLDGFFGSIKPKESLCFFYAKQAPFVEDPRRILVGVGRVSSLAKPVQYNREGAGAHSDIPYIWDVMIEHSIRPDGKDGFLLPYHQLAEYEANGCEVDWNRCVAFSPTDRTSEFSYTTEHVTHDGAISALLECKSALAGCGFSPCLMGDTEVLIPVNPRII